ncbi:hypothetical protein KIW84_014061 [Lathyrus oleraceus]|uniref:Uncharacterized protein n=1 Tax=Pisum sativum TaxID=3888 RepID=A0A9D5BM69_PEA|nr:hypothetical protein KIW84_014061 [Pisum sativum]
MIDMVEVEAVKETGTEGYVLDGKQATDGLNNDVPFEISVKEYVMCPRCGAVYNRELAEAFERIPSNQGWDGHEGNPNMYIFDKWGVPMRQDSPHPRAKRVMFKLPAEVPEDKWTQEVGMK